MSALWNLNFRSGFASYGATGAGKNAEFLRNLYWYFLKYQLRDEFSWDRSRLGVEKARRLAAVLNLYIPENENGELDSGLVEFVKSKLSNRSGYLELIGAFVKEHSSLEELQLPDEQFDVEEITKGFGKDDRFPDLLARVAHTRGWIIPNGSITHRLYAGVIKLTEDGDVMSDLTASGVEALASSNWRDVCDIIKMLVMRGDYVDEEDTSVQHISANIFAVTLPSDVAWPPFYFYEDQHNQNVRLNGEPVIIELKPTRRELEDTVRHVYDIANLDVGPEASQYE